MGGVGVGSGRTEGRERGRERQRERDDGISRVEGMGGVGSCREILRRRNPKSLFYSSFVHLAVMGCQVGFFNIAC